MTACNVSALVWPGLVESLIALSRLDVIAIELHIQAQLHADA